MRFLLAVIFGTGAGMGVYALTHSLILDILAAWFVSLFLTIVLREIYP